MHDVVGLAPEYAGQVEEEEGDGQRGFVAGVEDGLVFSVREAPAYAYRRSFPSGSGLGRVAQEGQPSSVGAVQALYLGRIPGSERICPQNLYAVREHRVAGEGGAFDPRLQVPGSEYRSLGPVNLQTSDLPALPAEDCELRGEESARAGAEGAFEGLSEPPPGSRVFLPHDTLPYAGKAVEFPDRRR